MRNAVLATHAEDNLQLFPPVFVEADANDLDARREVPQDSFARRMKLECGTDQEQQWRFRAQGPAGEIALALELAPLVVPLDAHPIIQGLQR